MPKSRILQVRISPQEHERLQNLAALQGFSKVSGFVRARCLADDLTLHEKVNLILNELKKTKMGGNDEVQKTSL